MRNKLITEANALLQPVAIQWSSVPYPCRAACAFQHGDVPLAISKLTCASPVMRKPPSTQLPWPGGEPTSPKRQTRPQHNQSHDQRRQAAHA